MARIVDSSNQQTSAAWAGDFFDREHLIPGGAKLDAAQFLATDGVTVTTTSSAAADATSMAVSALSGALPSGTMLYFGESKEFAMLTAAAAAGATSITVQALPSAIESGDSATYAGTTGIKRVVSGTAIGRTYAERDAGTAYGPADASDDETYLIAFDVTDASVSPDVELYRHGSIVKETFVPNWSSLTSGVKADIRAAYQTTIGAA